MVRDARIVMALLLLPLVSASAQTSSGATTSVSGDVFLVLQSGAMIQGAGLRVYLLRDTQEARGLYMSTCMTWDTLLHNVMAYETAVRDSFFNQLNTATDLEDSSYLAVKHKAYAALDSQNFISTTWINARFGSAVARNVVRKMSTGVKAHYSFRGVPEGRYRLFAQWSIGENNYHWWIPILLSRGKRIALDLHNDNVFPGDVVCARDVVPERFASDN